MTQAIILAAGRGERWNDYLHIPKQLLPIGDEPLLHRTVRLLRHHHISNIVIVAHDPALSVAGVDFFEPEQSEWVLETLCTTRSLWRDRTLILLGDVFYSERAMRKIVRFDGRMRFFGRRGPSRFTRGRWQEIFAISFNQLAAETLFDAAGQALTFVHHEGRGKLWDAYRVLAGFPLDSGLTDTALFFNIDDFTDDFDTAEDYLRAKKYYNIFLSEHRFRKWWLLASIYLNPIGEIYTLVKYLDAVFARRKAYQRISLKLRRQFKRKNKSFAEMALDNPLAKRYNLGVGDEGEK